MKILVSGTRTFNDYETLSTVLGNLFNEKKNEVEFVCGGCKGADTLGEKFAVANGFPCKVFKAEWSKYGRAAGPKRNKQMVDYVANDGVLVAFWDGASAGTLDTIKKAKKSGLRAVVYNYTEGVLNEDY